MPVGGTPLLVCTQFRWSFLYGRLQHLLTRLAATRPIYIVEAPVFNPGGAPQWGCSQPAPNLTLLQPHTPEPSSGFSAAQVAVLAPMLADWLAAEGLGNVMVWVDSVAAWPVVQALPAAITVYDCVGDPPADDRAAEGAVLAWA